MFELAIQACSFPLCLQENPSPGSYGLWGYQLFGVGLDLVFLLKDGVLPQNVIDSVYPVLVSGLFGLGDLIGNMIKGVSDWADASGILVSFAECINWMLFRPILRSQSGGLVALAVCGLTGVFYGCAGVVQIATAKSTLSGDRSDDLVTITPEIEA